MLIKDSKQRFSETAENYHRYRPSYPETLLHWISKTTGVTPPAKVADVGCGTGISTRFLAGYRYQTTGIEPNAEMIAFAKREGGAEYLLGEAAHTALPGNSVNLVTVAQAFHWFDVKAVMLEFKRILETRGWCVAFCNQRMKTPFLEDYQELLNKHRKHQESIPGHEETIQNIKSATGVENAREAEFSNQQLLDKEGLLGRAYSTSYVVHDMAEREKFDQALGKLFEKHQKDGRVEFLYRCRIIAWQLRS